MNAFEKAKADAKSLKSFNGNEAGPLHQLEAIKAEAEAFRDMVLDMDDVDDLRGTNLIKFSWEEK